MERERCGTLERVPRTPQNFSRIIWLSGIGTVARFRAFLIFLSRRLQGGWRAAPVPGGGLPPALPAHPAFSFDSAPYPPSPLPQRGRGRPKVYFAGGFAPGTPALNRLRHLQTLRTGARRGRLFTTRVPTAPAGANVPFEAERTGFPQVMPVPRPTQPRGCKGRSPLHKKTKNLPLPAGKGGGGLSFPFGEGGQKSKLKAG